MIRDFDRYNIWDTIFCKIWYFLVLMMLLMPFASCSQESQDAISEKYNSSYDNVFTYCCNLQIISDCLHISVSDLVKMRYGLIQPTSEIADILEELARLASKNESKALVNKLNKYLRDDPNFEVGTQVNIVPVPDLYSQYRKDVFVRNEKFDNDFPKYISSIVCDKTEKYIDKEFAWYRFPINAWDYVVDGKEALATRYRNGFNSILSVDTINSNIVSRVFNNYSELLNDEYKVLFNKNLDLPKLKRIDLEGTESIADENVIRNMEERAATDLTDVILNLIEEVGVAIIIWLVFRFLTNRVVNWYAAHVLDYDIDRGLKYNLFAAGLNFFNTWSMNDDLKRLKRIKRWVNGSIMVIFASVTYFYVIKPQIRIESEIIYSIESRMNEYALSLDAGILSYFNDIIEEVVL